MVAFIFIPSCQLVAILLSVRAVFRPAPVNTAVHPGCSRAEKIFSVFFQPFFQLTFGFFGLFQPAFLPGLRWFPGGSGKRE
jgi:hypothetical protein